MLVERLIKWLVEREREQFDKLHLGVEVDKSGKIFFTKTNMTTGNIWLFKDIKRSDISSEVFTKDTYLAKMLEDNLFRLMVSNDFTETEKLLVVNQISLKRDYYKLNFLKRLFTKRPVLIDFSTP